MEPTAPERQALAYLAAAAEQVKTLGAELTTLLDRLPATRPRQEAAMRGLDRPRSLAYALRADLECLLEDLVTPLAESLEASSRHTAESLTEDWLAARAEEKRLEELLAAR